MVAMLRSAAATQQAAAGDGGIRSVSCLRLARSGQPTRCSPVRGAFRILSPGSSWCGGGASRHWISGDGIQAAAGDPRSRPHQIGRGSAVCLCTAPGRKSKANLKVRGIMSCCSHVSIGCNQARCVCPRLLAATEGRLCLEMARQQCRVVIPSGTKRSGGICGCFSGHRLHLPWLGWNIFKSDRGLEACTLPGKFGTHLGLRTQADLGRCLFGLRNSQRMGRHFGGVEDLPGTMPSQRVAPTVNSNAAPTAMPT